VEASHGTGGLTRRDALRGAGGAALAVTVAPAWASARPRPSRGRDWPTTTRGPHGHRHATEPVTRAAERWRLRLAGGTPGAPAIVGRTVYAASYGGEVVAADLATGRERWRRALPLATYGDSISLVGTREVGFFAGPAVQGGRVFLASDRVWCLDARTGAQVWSAAPLRSDASDDYFWGAPVVAGGRVLVGSGSGSELPRARGKLSAYAIADGRLLWSTPTVPAGGNGGGVIVPPTVDAKRGLAYVVTGAPYQAVDGPNPGTGSLLAIRLRDGAIAWADQVHPHDERGLDLNSAPLLLGRRVFATAKDGVRGWDRLTRRRLWHRRLTPESALPGQGAGPYDGPEFGPLASDGRLLYALSNDAKGGSFVAAALRPRDGSVVWEARVPGLAFAAPAIAGRRLWVATAAGLLHALRLGDGELADGVPLGEPSAGAPAAARGALVVGTGTRPYLPGESLVCIGGR
jgi:outer membrane protein assembly factor BamB